MTREEASLLFEISTPKECSECYKAHDFTCSGADARRCEAYRMAIAALREQPRWISVEERLPSNEDVVLCVTKNKRPFVCRYDHYWKHWRVSGSVKITHWMPLPEPPKEEV